MSTNEPTKSLITAQNKPAHKTNTANIEFISTRVRCLLNNATMEGDVFGDGSCAYDDVDLRLHNITSAIELLQSLQLSLQADLVMLNMAGKK